MRYARAELLAKRTHQWALLAAVCFGALMLRLAWIQLIKHSYYATRAERLIGRRWPIPAPRGQIRDRNGLPLALNLKLYSVAADPKLLGDLPQAATRLSPVLRIPEAKLLDLLVGRKKDGSLPLRPVRYALLRDNVDELTADHVKALSLPGLIINGVTKRVYPKGPIGASLVGFMGDEPAGLSGIEARFNKTLAGQPGEQLVMLDGRRPRSRGSSPAPAACSGTCAPATTSSSPLTPPSRPSPTKLWRKR